MGNSLLFRSHELKKRRREALAAVAVPWQWHELQIRPLAHMQNNCEKRRGLSIVKISTLFPPTAASACFLQVRR